MSLRIFVARYLSIFSLAGFAFVPASAQAHVVCNYDQYGKPYNCYQAVVAQPQYRCGACCNTCGNRGLFTSTWVAPAPQPEPQTYDDDDDTTIQPPNRYDAPRTHRPRHTSHQPRRTAARHCGYVNGTWHCVPQVSHQHQRKHISSRN